MYRTYSTLRHKITIRNQEETLVFFDKRIACARRRSQKGSVLRNPVPVQIDEQDYLFTKNEWEKGRIAGYFRYGRPVQRVMKEQLEDQRKASPKLSKERAARFRREADAVFYEKKDR